VGLRRRILGALVVAADRGQRRVERWAGGLASRAGNARLEVEDHREYDAPALRDGARELAVGIDLDQVLFLGVEGPSRRRPGPHTEGVETLRQPGHDLALAIGLRLPQ